MNWTAGTPTTSGYYWWRESTGEEPCIVEVDIQRGTVLSLGTDEAPTLDEMEGEATAHWCCHDDLDYSETQTRRLVLSAQCRA